MVKPSLMGWIVSPKRYVNKFSLPVAQNVTLFGKKVIPDVIRWDVVIFRQGGPELNITGILVRRERDPQGEYPVMMEAEIQLL